MLRAIIYTDGGAVPNPGVIGSGVHGYIFDTTSKEIKKDKNQPTDLGYLTSDEIKLKPNYKAVKPLFYLDYVLTHSFEGSNNTAEIYAILQGVKTCLAKYPDVKEIILYTDSMVAISALKGMENDAKAYSRRSSLKKDVLGEIEDFTQLIKNAEVKLNVNKIKAHSFHYGNQLADTYATLGMTNSTSIITHSDAKGYTTPKRVDGLLSANKIYFVTNKVTPAVYNFISIKEEGWIGRPNPKGLAYGVYKGKSIPEYDEVIQRLNDKVYNERPAIVNVTNLTSGMSKHLLARFGSMAFRTSGKGGTNIALGNPLKRGSREFIVANVIDPAPLKREAENMFSMCNAVINCKLKGESTFQYIDITEDVYDGEKANGKKFVAQDTYVTNYTYDPKQDELKRGFKCKFKLEYNLDLPPKATLNKNMPKVGVKVYLVMMWNELKCDYFTLTVMGDEYIAQTHDAAIVMT